IQTITQQAAAAADEIVTYPAIVTDDTVPPVIVSTQRPTGLHDNEVEIRFSKPMDSASVTDPNHFIVTDGSGNLVKGVIQLLQNDTVAVFRPEVPFRLGEQYGVVLIGAKDKAGNSLQAETIDFRKPKPLVASSLLQELGKCTGNP